MCVHIHNSNYTYTYTHASGTMSGSHTGLYVCHHQPWPAAWHGQDGTTTFAQGTRMTMTGMMAAGSMPTTHGPQVTTTTPMCGMLAHNPHTMMPTAVIIAVGPEAAPGTVGRSGAHNLERTLMIHMSSMQRASLVGMSCHLHLQWLAPGPPPDRRAPRQWNAQHGRLRRRQTCGDSSLRAWHLT